MQNVLSPSFASPVSTTLNELVQLQSLASLLTSKKRRTAARQLGTAPSKQFGRGLDFAEVREYHAGDEVRMMDWNVTARTGRAHIKVFMEERERPVVFIVDLSQSMQFGTQGMFKSAMAVRLAGLLAWCALNDGDRIGGIVAHAHSMQRIRPAGQRSGLLRLFHALTSEHAPTVQNESSNPHRPLLDALQQTRVLAPSGSRVVLISDFHGLDEPLKQQILSLLKRTEVTPICVQDALEHSLPVKGVLPVKGRQQGGLLSLLDTRASAQKTHAEKAVHTRDEIRQLFLTGGQAVNFVQSHESLADAATQSWFGLQSVQNAQGLKAHV